MAWFHGESDEVAGSSKIPADLREDGETISKKTVAKTMRELGLVAVCRSDGRRPRALIRPTPTPLTSCNESGTPGLSTKSGSATFSA